MRTIAIGDIHGCLTSLETLVDAIELRPEDTLVTLGDYVDRGPDSRGVIEYLLRLREEREVVTLLGNHEVMMLEGKSSFKMRCNWERPLVGGMETLASYDPPDIKSVPKEHWSFITDCEMFYETDSHFFVHANADPHLPLDEQPAMNLLWERFDHPAAHDNGKTMVCGHTAQQDGLPYDVGHAVCIDTWVYGDGWLTALDVTTGTYWQSNEQGDTRERCLGQAEDTVV